MFMEKISKYDFFLNGRREIGIWRFVVVVSDCGISRWEKVREIRVGVLVKVIV